MTKQPGIIDVVADVNGYTEANFGTGERPAGFDTDRDGIPDEWETINGLNPNDANDAQLYTIDQEKGWYTNLEVYLNSLVEDIMKAGNADAQSAVDEYYPAYLKPDGIHTVIAAQTVRTDYFTIDGKQVKTPSRGLYLVRETLSDGSVITQKVVF